MAKLSEKAVKAFQKLVLEKRGVKLSYEHAEAIAYEWLEFIYLICKPIPKERNGKERKKDNN